MTKASFLREIAARQQSSQANRILFFFQIKEYSLSLVAKLFECIFETES